MFNVSEKVKVANGLNSDAEGTVIKVKYCVQFGNKEVGWYNENDLVSPPAPVVQSVPQVAASVAPKTEAGVKK
jgi:hypothetical protein